MCGNTNQDLDDFPDDISKYFFDLTLLVRHCKLISDTTRYSHWHQEQGSNSMTTLK